MSGDEEVTKVLLRDIRRGFGHLRREEDLRFLLEAAELQRLLIPANGELHSIFFKFEIILIYF